MFRHIDVLCINGQESCRCKTRDRFAKFVAGMMFLRVNRNLKLASTGHSDLTLSVDSLARSPAANRYYLRLLPLSAKVNDHELQTVGNFLWISSIDSRAVRTAHCRPARPQSPLSLPARLFASGRTAEPDAPLRFTFVTTRAERNRASFYYPLNAPLSTVSHHGAARPTRALRLTTTQAPSHRPQTLSEIQRSSD
jgi:hypothetical protein